MQDRADWPLAAFSTRREIGQKMNPATHGTEGSVLAPVLYMALELSNKSWKLAFGDVPQQIHAVARRSLYARVIKLAHGGRVTKSSCGGSCA